MAGGESGNFSIIGQPPRAPKTRITNNTDVLQPRHAICQICTSASGPSPNTADNVPLPNNNQHDNAAYPSKQSSSANNSLSWTSALRQRRAALPNMRGLGLEASFVNVPNSFNSTDVDKIDSIITSALKSTYGEAANGINENPGIKNGESSLDMYEASRRMNAFVEATQMILSGGVRDNIEEPHHFLCKTCVERIGIALGTSAECLEDECNAYEESSSKEEERATSIRHVLTQVLGINSSTNGAKPDFSEGEEPAIHWALDSFQMELDALTNACNEQEKELQLLQNLMREQMAQSDLISYEENLVLQELNALEIDAHNFGEESHFVSNRCSAVMEEIQSMCNVKLVSIPFKVVADSQSSGNYPTINNLRLAYRANKKSGVAWAEINSAWSQAAQLVNYVCGLNNFNSPSIRLIPLSHPCAKLLTTFTGGQSVHDLGCDTASAPGRQNSVPKGSLVSFLSLLSQLTSHILSSGVAGASTPPFQMTNYSINFIDVTKLAELDVSSWSSVVFCIAANLHWLSKLPMDAHIV